MLLARHEGTASNKNNVDINPLITNNHNEDRNAPIANNHGATYSVTHVQSTPLPDEDQQ